MGKPKVAKIETAAQRSNKDKVDLSQAVDPTVMRKGERKMITFKCSYRQFNASTGEKISEVNQYPKMHLFEAVQWLKRQNDGNRSAQITVAYNPVKFIASSSDEDKKLRAHLKQVETLLKERKGK